MDPKSYLIRVGTKEKQIERNSSHQVDEEPAAEVMDSDLARMRDHLVVIVDERRSKIDEDVDDEHDVHYTIDHRRRFSQQLTRLESNVETYREGR